MAGISWRPPSFYSFSNPAPVFSFGVMFKPMIAELGWDRASMSFAFFFEHGFFCIDHEHRRKAL